MRLFVLFLILCSPLYSLPLGNPADASHYCEGRGFAFRYGFYGDYVFDRHLEVSSSAVGNSDLDDFELYTNAGFLALNYCNRYDIFVSLGASSSFIFDNAESFWVLGSERHGQPLRIFTDTGFSWSVGARGTIWEYNCFSFGAEGQYFSTNMGVEHITFQGDNTNSPSGMTMHYQEWQFGVGMTWQINELLRPYAGIDVAGVNVDFNKPSVVFGTNTFTLFDLKAQKYFGYAIGLTLVFCENSTFSVEGRFADEKGVNINGQIRF